MGNIQDANDYLNLKNEDEQRRWFYAQTLTVKLSLSDKTKARKTLISDLYAKVRDEGVPIEKWVDWIRTQLMPEDTVAEGQPSAQQQQVSQSGLRPSPPQPSTSSASSLMQPKRYQPDLDRTMPVPPTGATNPMMMSSQASRLSESFPSRFNPAVRTTTTAAAPASNPVSRVPSHGTMYVRRA